MKETDHLGLSQWDPTDRILRTDFNADNAKIDAALADRFIPFSADFTFRDVSSVSFALPSSTGIYSTVKPEITFFGGK